MKKFILQPDQIRSLSPAKGCALATDRITVDGAPVSYIYRSAPINEEDSGWRFVLITLTNILKPKSPRFREGSGTITFS